MNKPKHGLTFKVLRFLKVSGDHEPDEKHNHSDVYLNPYNPLTYILTLILSIPVVIMEGLSALPELKAETCELLRNYYKYSEQAKPKVKPIQVRIPEAGEVWNSSVSGNVLVLSVTRDERGELSEIRGKLLDIRIACVFRFLTFKSWDREYSYVRKATDKDIEGLYD